MPEILIQSKITAPRLHDKIVRRERLTSLILENKDKNLIIVCAPAGFGKTTLVLDYLSFVKDKCAWFSIPHKGIEDASTFFEYLIGALKSINPDFGNTTLDVMKMYTQNPKMAKELVYACTASIVNEFSEYFKDEVILVIDDLHFINTEKARAWLKEFFTELLDNIPPNLHLICVTRVMPQINLTEIKAKRNAFIVDENLLGFSEDETASLLKEVYRYKFDKKDIKLLEENVKGWITGLHLLLQAYGEDFNKVEYKGKLEKDVIFDFFAQEIFDSLSPELQEFMMVTSLMESFNDELANSVLDISNAIELTDELIRKNLFIHQIHTTHQENKSISYGYHALFRDFLNRKLKDSRIEQEIKYLMEKIGDSFQKTGDKISAVNYYMDVKIYNKAVPLILEIFWKLYNAGRYENIWHWFNIIPEGIIKNTADLLYYFGYLYLYSRSDYEKSMYYINLSYEIYKQKNDEYNIVQCLNVRTRILINTGKALEAKAELEKQKKNILKCNNILDINMSLYDVYTALYMYEEALALIKDIKELCDNESISVNRKGNVYSILARSCYKTCEYDKAIEYFKESLKYEKIHYNVIMTYCNIALVYNETYDYNNSLKYFDKAFKELEKSNSNEILIQVSGQKALLLQSIGAFEESTKLLIKTISLAEKSKALSQLWYLTDYLTMNSIMTGDYINTKKYLKSNKINAGDSNYYKDINKIREANYLLKYDLVHLDPDLLIESYNYFSSNKKEYFIFQYLWLLALYYISIDKLDETSKYLQSYLCKTEFDAINISEKRELIDFALSCPELAKYKDKVHHAFTEFFDRLNIEGTSDEYKAKMKIEIDNLYDINMKAFGSLEFKHRGEPVTESKWRKKKGKSVLAYMMINPKAKYNKDKLIDMFFPDVKPVSMEDNWKQAIFNIRSAFKNKYLNFLILEGKMLYLNPDCYFKSDAEEFNKYCNIARSAESAVEQKIQACKDAIKLYKGEFIEGNYEQWCEDLRLDFHNKYISISELLLDLLSKDKNHEEILYYSEKLLKHDKLNEKAYLYSVEAYVKLEKRKSAKESYSKMLKIYNEELAEAPDIKILNKIKNMLEN